MGVTGRKAGKERGRSPARRGLAQASTSSSSSSSSLEKNVQDKATKEAWQVPTRTLTALLLMPTAILMVKVGSLDRWIGVQLAVCCLVSVVAYFVTCKMIPLVADKLVNKLFGIDIGKRGLGGKHDGEKVPESLGIVSSTVFMISVGILQFLFGSGNNQILEYNTALLSVCFATLLGIMDDLIDIKWKHKVLIGALMSLPLLLSYKGTTSILVPKALSPFIYSQHEGSESTLGQLLNSIPTVKVGPEGHLLDLGAIYYVYMFVMVVFCTNAINIYAGINGIEVGQSIVTACSITVVNLIDLHWRGGSAEEILSGDGKNHLFSLMLMLPFISTSFALLRFNFYPARVFVGDVYPYYAGISIATAAILGHFSKSLLFLVIPQFVNFLYSLPQLFRVVPCPRHRLPKINLKTGFLEASKVAPGDPRSNMTLICAALDRFGPMHERTLCVVLLLFQAICAIIGIALRYPIAEYIFSYQ